MRDCVVSFLEKDPSLGGEVVRGLLRLWPVRSTAKQELYLEELEELLQFCDPDDFATTQAGAGADGDGDGDDGGDGGGGGGGGLAARVYRQLAQSLNSR
eukprot:SAG22_NODE_77_length_22125_cov_46.140016_13_plen_99_part_00